MSRSATNEAVFKPRRPTALRFRCLLLAIIIFGGRYIYLIMETSTNPYFVRYHPSDDLWGKRLPSVINSEINYTINTEGCSIPEMEPLSYAVRKYIKYPSDLKSCPDSEHRLLVTDNAKIWINKKHMPIYINGISDILVNMTCCYQAFHRPIFNKVITSTSTNQDRVIYKVCKYFNDTINVEDEFVRIECFLNSEKFYEQYFLFALDKKVFFNVTEKPEIDPGYNVVILGIDNVSRLHFIRTMPKTVNFLKKKGAVEMLGYNKVGDNSWPNLIPISLGIKHTELRRLCIPRNRVTTYVCPFIWEWFKQAGYHTVLGEDSSSLGTFNDVKWKFLNSPTDYYLHTFMEQAELNVGKYKNGNSVICMHDIPFFKVLLNYLEDLTTILKKSKLFGFFWEITMSHDNLNFPMAMDDDYEQVLISLEAKNYLNNTVLIVVSDHGIRWGGIRQTKQGRLEERLPFLYILTPPSFNTKYSYAYDNLKVNSKRLTTPFDLHATLSDLIYPYLSISDISILARSKTYYSKNRGISLFLPVPFNRTCKAADIDDHWCTCYRHFAIPTTNRAVLEAATELVSLLNKMLKGYAQCAKLTLLKVIEANFIEAGKTEENEVGWNEMMVVVTTDPGGGIFEATLRKDKNGWSLLGSASRLNLYGKKSHCVDDHLLKLYCYCL